MPQLLAYLQQTRPSFIFTIVFLDPDFLYNARIPATHLQTFKAKLAYLYLHGFSGLFGQNSGFWAQNMGSGGAMLTPPTDAFLRLGVVTSMPLLTKIDQEIRL